MNKETRITPISSSFETCAECFARLMIYPGNRHPDEITELLKIQPTEINVAGSSITNSRGLTRRVKESGWFLDSGSHMFSKDIREHIDWIIEKIMPNHVALKNIQEMNDVKMTLKCVWFSLLGHSGPVLWPEQMRALANLDLECSFDVYFLDN